MAREKYPEQLLVFWAYTLPDEWHKEHFPKEELRHSYGGVITPNSEPMTQAQYDKQVKKKLDHYKSLSHVVRIETVWFRRDPVGEGRGPEVWEPKKKVAAA